MNILVRFILGSISLGAVWFAAWPTETGNWGPFVLAIAFSAAASAFASWISLKMNKRNKGAPLAFAAPFAFFALICVPALVDGTYRPFVFWASIASAGFVFSAVSDALVFRKIVEDEEA